ncbi:hypothetical protein ACPPVO_11245 [Dactylosporangium sp. McL0621]|uniref:hypothetical protein n=1 Tax=Dactylosporangium sp. McL0621 TaxID=3415678 RepID=UPI003CE691FD
MLAAALSSRWFALSAAARSCSWLSVASRSRSMSASVSAAAAKRQYVSCVAHIATTNTMCSNENQTG